MNATQIEQLIKDSLPDAHVSVRDLVGDGDHYAVEVISKTFQGKTRIQQHKMVYAALKTSGVPHALTLHTSIPQDT